uniref:Uncharacterized protein n=1 Tax=Arundo donax TaxID=35708 RepID=A0A0A9CNV7_ARUDO
MSVCVGDFTTVYYFHFTRRHSTINRTNCFQLLNQSHSTDHLPKDHVFTIKMRQGLECYKKLGSIAIWSRICHG